MSNAWGVWCNHKVSNFNFSAAVNAGASFAVGQMNTGHGQFNPAWPVFVQAAYDADVPVVGGHYQFELKMAPGAAQDLPNWQLPPGGGLNDDNAFVKEVYSYVKHKWMQVLIVEYTGILLEDGRTPAFDDGWSGWAGTIMHSFTNYLRDNIHKANSRIKHVVPMVSKGFIDKYFPALKDTDFIRHDIFVSDFNVAGSPHPMSAWSSVPDMYRPPEPLDVLHSTNWRFCRWSNAAFETPDFDGAVGAADFNGSVAKLSQWTGVEIGDVEPPEPPDPPIEPPDPPVIPSVDVTPELLSLADTFECISVEFMGAKHVLDQLIEKLEEK